jgi:hypothetical protein
MALRQNDQAQATEAGNAFIARSPRPYSKEVWAVIAAITRTAKDRGYELLRPQTDEAKAAQKKILEVIGREAIEPYFKDKGRTPDWADLERPVTSQYGALGREAVYGAQMMYESRRTG